MMMSTLVENVQKVVDAHAGLSTAIASRGVAVPEGVKLSQMPELVESIEVREPVYIPNTFNFNGYLSGEDMLNIHLDATKPITIDPTMAMSYESMFKNCLARSIVVPELTSLYIEDLEMYIGGNSRSMFAGAGLMSSFTVPRGFWSRRTNCTSMLSGCSSLISIDMSEEDGGALSGMTRMNYMFNYCTSLSSIEFPEGSGTQLSDTRIAGGFSHCTSLQKLVFPAGFGGAVTWLSPTNLTDCNNLRRIEFGAGAFPNLSDFGWLQNNNLSAIDFGSEDFGLSVSQLVCQFLNKLSSLELPDNFGLSSKKGYLNLGYYGVYGCPQLTSIKLPANVRCYSNGAIYPDACRKLTHITFPTAPGKSYESYTTGTHAVFPQCSSLQHLEGNLMLQTTGTIDISHLVQLDHSSLLLIINGLYDYVAAGSSGTRFIKLGDVNSAALSDEEKTIATSKGWTLT